MQIWVDSEGELCCVLCCDVLCFTVYCAVFCHVLLCCVLCGTVMWSVLPYFSVCCTVLGVQARSVYSIDPMLQFLLLHTIDIVHLRSFIFIIVIFAFLCLIV